MMKGEGEEGSSHGSHRSPLSRYKFSERACEDCQSVCRGVCVCVCRGMCVCVEVCVCTCDVCACEDVCTCKSECTASTCDITLL